MTSGVTLSFRSVFGTLILLNYSCLPLAGRRVPVSEGCKERFVWFNQKCWFFTLWERSVIEKRNSQISVLGLVPSTDFLNCCHIVSTKTEKGDPTQGKEDKSTRKALYIMVYLIDIEIPSIRLSGFISVIISFHDICSLILSKTTQFFFVFLGFDL